MYVIYIIDTTCYDYCCSFTAYDEKTKNTIVHGLTIAISCDTTFIIDKKIDVFFNGNLIESYWGK